MNIDEAIRLKQLEGDEFLHADPDELDEADRLSIEALKFLGKIPCLPVRPGRDPLPGETEE